MAIWRLYLAFCDWDWRFKFGDLVIAFFVWLFGIL